MPVDRPEAPSLEINRPTDLTPSGDTAATISATSAPVSEQAHTTTVQSANEEAKPEHLESDRSCSPRTVLPQAIDGHDVEMLQENSTETDPATRLASADPDSKVVIDLTKYDSGDDNETSPQSTSSPQQTLEKPMKEEQVESPEPALIEEHSSHGSAHPDNFHDLPAFQPTPLPNETFSEAENYETNENIELTSAAMAEMLKQFDSRRPQLPLQNMEYDSDQEDIQAVLLFEKQKAEYEERKKAGHVHLAADIDFKRIQDTEMARRRTRKDRKQREYESAQKAIQEQSMFIPEREESPVEILSGNEMDVDNNNTDVPDTTSSTTRRKSTVQMPAQKKARGRPKGSKAGPPGRKTAGKTAVQKAQVSKSGAKRGRKPKELPVIDTVRLLHSNVIGAANANEGQAQPTFTSTRKKDALAELIASIPVGDRDQYAGDQADIEKATKNFNGRGAMKSDGHGNWKLRGMRTSLKNYQLLGVSWMRSRESQYKHPRGGILSDDMGLGKTVSTLANMVDGRASENQTGAKATLIVVPPTIMSQWLAEIEKHLETPGKVMVYRSKMKFLDPAAYLADQDIVITSYHEILRSLPKNDPPPHIFTARAKQEWWEKEFEEKKGPLHRVHWHRIVLDEAQTIKNHLSRTSEAVCILKGRYRWCLSGTPIQNGLEEFYPYFKFLRVEQTGSFELFKRNFAKRGSEKALQRLQVYLGKIMLRRTHSDTLFGLPIIQLPPIKPVQTIEVDFNTVERNLYRIVKHRFVHKVKLLGKKDNPENNYRQILVLLLRLRQLVGHPLLIQKTLKDILEVEDLELLWSLSDPSTLDSEGNGDTSGNVETAVVVRNAVQYSKVSEQASHPGSKRKPVVDNAMSRHFREYMDALRKDGNWAEANKRALCAACGSPPENAHITICHHIYCHACLNDLIYEARKLKIDALCMECGTVVKKGEAFIATTFDQGSRRNSNGSNNEDEDIDWYNVPGPMLRSAKVKGAVAKIKEWFEQDPSNKIIVFTQFRGMIKIMQRICNEETNWGYATYHGAMSFDLRDLEIQRFTNKRECRILLAALKAGGVGLNLTAANRVIILDPWWNVSVETQAFTRCFRIGQQRDVEIARVVVHDSIDISILEMQARKIAEIEKAMEERHRPLLSTQELIELFGSEDDDGQVKTNDDGAGAQSQKQIYTGEDEPFIMPDDPYAEKHSDEEDGNMMAEG